MIILNRRIHLTINCFRLLNSEIGNDRKDIQIEQMKPKGFRLLNSEIGNDLY